MNPNDQQAALPTDPTTVEFHSSDTRDAYAKLMHGSIEWSMRCQHEGQGPHYNEACTKAADAIANLRMGLNSQIEISNELRAMLATPPAADAGAVAWINPRDLAILPKRGFAQVMRRPLPDIGITQPLYTRPGPITDGSSIHNVNASDEK